MGHIILIRTFIFQHLAIDSKQNDCNNNGGDIRSDVSIVLYFLVYSKLRAYKKQLIAHGIV